MRSIETTAEYCAIVIGLVAILTLPGCGPTTFERETAPVNAALDAAMQRAILCMQFPESIYCGR